jgi:hypothetical protein
MTHDTSRMISDPLSNMLRRISVVITITEACELMLTSGEGREGEGGEGEGG